MGIIKKSTPGYQMTIDSLIRGIISGPAPRSLNRGSMVGSPQVTKNATIPTSGGRINKIEELEKRLICTFRAFPT